MRITIDVDSARTISAAFVAAPEMVVEELETAMLSSLAYLGREMAERTPTNMGTLRRSYDRRVSTFVDAVFGEITSPLTYALPVELGTKPHFPPIEPLVDWVEAKLGLYGDEAESAARGIQRKIGRFGSPGYGMARFALLDGLSTVQAEFADAAGRIAARLAGSAA